MEILENQSYYKFWWSQCKGKFSKSLGLFPLSFGGKNLEEFWQTFEYEVLETSYASYRRERKYMHPYYISSIEIGLLWAKIKYLKIHSKAMGFELQTDMK